MAHAFPGSLKRSLIATAAVVALGTVGATCGVVVRGPADAQPGAKLSEATPVAGAGPFRVCARAPACCRDGEMTNKSVRMPLSALVLFVLAVLALIPALMCFAGEGERLHPVLSDPMAGLAFLVSAIALAGSGAFPLVLARLARRDRD